MKRADALDRAKKAVCDRNASYGKPEDNFSRIANRWNAHLVNIGLLAGPEELPEAGFGPHDVAIMLADVKLARAGNDPSKADNWIDLAGYASCGAEVSGAIDAELPQIPLKGCVNECDAPRDAVRGFRIGEVVNTKDSDAGDLPGVIHSIFLNDRGLPSAEVKWSTGSGDISSILLSDLRHGV